MSGKYALIIGNTEYIDPGLAQLTAPGKDAEDFAWVLKDPNTCAFDDVKVLLNEPEPVARGAIDEFFDEKRPDDLLVLYFSGHGVRDELGTLYLAVRNTIRSRLRSTAVKSDYIREVMDQSRSRRQVLILDCCNSGAFAQGTKAATGVSIGTATAFESGYGRIILTASDSTQFAWEGDKVIGETDNSLFTHFLVEGLEGEADLDSDGRITVDELYDYAYDKVKLATPKQTPSKFSSKQQGEIVLRQFMRLEDIKPISLPEQLISEIENPYPEVRLRAVQQLARLLNGKNLGLARSAREALEHIEQEDDSRRVSQAATQTLEPIRQAEQLALQKANEEAQRLLAEQKAEEERIAKSRVEAERLAEEKRLAEARAAEERKAREQAETSLREAEKAKRLSGQKAETLAQEIRPLESSKVTELEAPSQLTFSPKWISVLWIMLGWAISWTILDWVITSTIIAWTVGGATGGLITAFILRREHILSQWKSMPWIVLGWAGGWAISWTIGGRIGGAIGLELDSVTGWAIGGAIIGAIGGAIGGLATVIALRTENALSNLKTSFWVTLGWIFGWAVGGATDWAIGSTINSLFNLIISWAIGSAIGGFVMVWQIREDKKKK